MGSWDPYNVTEDADLGMRLCRLGYRSQMLDSTTYEESCSEIGNWLGQRTRWFKGWIQTYAVHMRAPLRSLRELGLTGFLTLQLMMGGLLVSALVHPLFLLILFASAFTHVLFQVPGDGLQEFLLVLNVWNLSAGYVGGIALGLCGLQAANVRGLARSVIFIPIYWLIISLAAYRAVWQFARNPFYWEKTRHGHMTLGHRKRQSSPKSPTGTLKLP